jgi:hypothetical protein
MFKQGWTQIILPSPTMVHGGIKILTTTSSTSGLTQHRRPDPELELHHALPASSIQLHMSANLYSLTATRKK